MKYSKRKLGVRLIAFVPFLLFVLTVGVLSGLMLAFRWLRLGGNLLIYKNEKEGVNISDLINNTKELVELLKNEKK